MLSNMVREHYIDARRGDAPRPRVLQAARGRRSASTRSWSDSPLKKPCRSSTRRRSSTRPAVRALALALALAGCGDNLHVLAFDRIVVDPAFRSEGIAVFDVDHDGHLDLVTPELWYAGPRFTPHEVRAPRAYDPLTTYADGFHAFHLDVDHDGYEDLVWWAIPTGAVSWCRDPEGADVHWECHEALASTVSESPFVADLEGAGPVAVTEVEPARELAILAPGADATAPWDARPLTAPGFLPAAEHGLGPVDIDGDGRLDVVTGAGWLQQPAVPGPAPWPWHPLELCENDCAQVAGFDLSGDGRIDLVGTSPHHYGVWWFEQVPGAEPAFVRHLIDDSVSETHAMQLVDLDGDGLPEVITGKRWYAHFAEDPGIDDPVVLVIYQPRFEAGALAWTKLEVDGDSGVGNQFEVADLDGDGDLDLAIASRKGVFVFRQR